MIGRSFAAVCLLMFMPGTVWGAPFLAELTNRLAAERAVIEKDRQALNTQCVSVPASHKEKVIGCQLWRDEVAKRMEKYKADYRSLELVREAVAGERDFFYSIPQDDIRIPLGVQILAKRLKWSAEKQNRLEKALKEIGFDGLAEITEENVRKGWGAIWTNADDKALIRIADKAGPSLPAVGQKESNDCAVAAMATASGLSYAEVARQAKSLIEKGEWRDQAVRKDPQEALRQGLSGGEVIMLAESLGRVEVVPSSRFEATLKKGQPVMVNVVTAGTKPQGFPPGSSATVLGNHQLVLTKTFRHDDKTWYEIADSRYPDTRFFATPDQLNLILQEKGIAYGREK